MVNNYQWLNTGIHNSIHVELHTAAAVHAHVQSLGLPQGIRQQQPLVLQRVRSSPSRDSSADDHQTEVIVNVNVEL